MDATIDTTPSVSAETSPAAPATSAPSASEPQSQRPTSFAEAFARDAASQSETPAAPTETAATAPAADPALDGAKPAGPIPFDAHKTALENARVKERERVTQELEQQYGWAKTLDRAVVEQGHQIGKLYTEDRPGFIRQVLAEALATPDLAPMVRSEAARVLASRTPQTPAVDLSPDIPVVDDTGRVVAQTFSADRVKQIVDHAVQAALGKELQPLKQDYESRQQREQQAKTDAALQSTVSTMFDTLTQTLPGFSDHMAEIAKVMESIPGDPVLAAQQAWHRVVGSTLQNSDQVKAQALKELQTKAAASMSAVNPASAALPPARRVTSFRDPSLKWE